MMRLKLLANQNNKKAARKAWLLAAVLLLIVALVAGAVVIRQKGDEHKADEEYSEIASQVNSLAQEEPEETQEPPKEYTLEEKIQLLEAHYGITVPQKNLNFEKLQAETNPDIYAWLYIPGTNVDYPVLQHPDDDEFYLMHNLDGSYGYPSCVYSEPSVTAKDFNDRMTVLYAHDLSGGRMFGDLKHFAEKEYFDANRYMFVYLPDDIKVYEIFSSVKYIDIHLLKAYDWTDDSVYEQFIVHG